MDITFAFPMTQAPLWLLAGLLLLGGIAFVLRYFERKRDGRMQRFVDSALAPRLLLAYDARIRKPMFWFVLAGFAMLALAFAQPRWGKAWVEVDRGSRDILILLDTSESMNAKDVAPSRIERARLKVESLMALCPGDRFGLIAFSGAAALQCPLTLDHAYFRSILAAIGPNTISEEGSDIAAALHEAENVFEEDIAKTGEEHRYARVALLISDGEESTGEAVKVAERMGRYAGIYVIGAGSPEGAIIEFPQWMRRYVRVSDDELTRQTRLEEAKLSEIAVKGGGIYVRNTPDNSDVALIHRELEQVMARAVSGDMRFSKVNRYRWPLSAAVFCFAAEGGWIALMPWVRRWRMARSTS
jgi:Ca-activated chloride channel family protein